MGRTQKEKDGQKFLLSIYENFWRDPQFRERLIEDPIQALNDFTGIEVSMPPNKTIIVEDQTNPDHIYLNIPAQPVLDDVDLDDEQLDFVTGGGDDKSFWDAVYAITTNPLDSIKYVMDHE